MFPEFASQDHTISVIVPVYNGSTTLPECLEALAASDYRNYECIVVDDGSTDDSAEIARDAGARVMSLGGGPSGPAHARNKGAEIARGDILFFIDADVVVSSNSLRQIVSRFAASPEITALFGSYDTAPGNEVFLSQYKNLAHHFVHQNAMEEASTFWTGCGAIKRSVFHELGGFDAGAYPRASIEDIDLGYRLQASGYQIRLDKSLQVKHLKHWSLRGLLQTDVFARAIPWTRLSMRSRHLPDDLNLSISQRLSALITVAGVALSLASIFYTPLALLLPLLFILMLLSWSSWNWEGGVASLNISHKRAAICHSVLAVAILLAGYYDMLGVITLLLIVSAAIAIEQLWPRQSDLVGRSVILIVMLGVTMSHILLLNALPIWLSIILITSLILVIALNWQLYRFFLRTGGPLFALAALPFQLFYYLYSVLAFAFTFATHHMETNRLERAGVTDLSQD